MPARTSPADVAHLVDAADALAGSWSAAAAARTSTGQERALLRLYGVDGLDRAGRPLAAEVVDRFLAGDRSRLGDGISLPLAMAMAEYDLGPQEVALDAAAGSIDLALEAELLLEPTRRHIAEANAERLARAALERMDANRLARRELVDVLGDAHRPLIGVPLLEPAIVDALDEARGAVGSGADLLGIAVPPSRELAAVLARAGRPVTTWRPNPGSRPGLEAPDSAAVPVPTGSQRALAALRRAADELAARRGAYIRLATEAAALNAPEQAVVACFERIDVVLTDPMREVIAGRVDPDRAIADHAFAHRLLARAGTTVVIGAGPLVVAPDLASGMPSDAATRGGRTLALQLLAVRLAVRDGLPAERLLVDALPEWIVDEADAPARAAAEIAVRRAVFPDHPFACIEPALAPDLAGTWGAIVAGVLPDAGSVDLLLRRPGGSAGHAVTATRSIAAVARSLGRDAAPAPLGNVSAAHAAGVIAAAATTLERLASMGWGAVIDERQVESDRLGGQAVADRRESFDPFVAADDAR